MDKIKKLPKVVKGLGVLIMLGLVAFGGKILFFSSEESSSYRTKTVEKGTLITSISSTGTISSANKTAISSGATGRISKVYVKDGDSVKKGQKIADIVLDDDGQKNKVSAWANYLTLLQKEKEAIADRSAADIEMWADRQKVLDAQEEYNNMVAGGWNEKTKAEYTYNEKAIVEKTLAMAKESFSASETKYNNYSAYIQKASQERAEALDNYNKVSTSIYAPEAGIVSNLSIAEGVEISNDSESITVSTGTNSGSDSSSVKSHNVGSITDPKGKYQATLSLTESDIPKIKAGQKVILKLDAFEGKSFTGEVLAIDVSGTSSSGVTSYPVVVLMDETEVEIYKNMAVSATIIVNTKTDVLLVPSSAIDESAGVKSVRVMKEGEVKIVTIEVGESNGSESEVISGLSEGDEVVSSSLSNESKANNNESSEFSGGSNFRMGGGMEGAAVVRMGP